MIAMDANGQYNITDIAAGILFQKGDQPKKRDKRILVADDDRLSRVQLTDILSKWDFEVITANDGNQAWEVLKQEDPPRLAILDWVMPGMAGIGITRRLRALRKSPYTYIILLTAKANREDLLEGMDAGADDYIIKPFDVDELMVRIRAGQRIVELQEEVMRANARLSYAATHDQLTGVLNHRSIMEVLDCELTRTRREKLPLGLIMADIDFFKRVNDTFGHQTGDLVLQEAVRRIGGTAGARCKVGRYGGEEFVVVAPGLDVEQTRELAEQIRRHVDTDPIVTPEGHVAVTISLGATVNSQNPASPAELIGAADRALYLAKKNGRNRVEFERLE